MIASIGINLPQDLFVATGRYDGPVAIDLARTDGPASQWIESKFAPWVRPLVNQWEGGQLDHLEAVIFSRADDNAHRAYYYISELQRRGLVKGPEAMVCDIAKIDRPSSIARTSNSVRTLAERFGVSDDALEEGIQTTNVARKQHRPKSGPVCVLLGTAPPDRRLHDIIEKHDFVAAGRTLLEEWCWPGALVDENTGDPAAAIGRQLHAASDGPRSFADPFEHLKAAISQNSVKAVILWRIEEDEAQSWHLPAQRRALAESGLPHLILTRRDWMAQDGVDAEITQFLKEAV